MVIILFLLGTSFGFSLSNVILVCDQIQQKGWTYNNGLDLILQIFAIIFILSLLQVCTTYLGTTRL